MLRPAAIVASAAALFGVAPLLTRLPPVAAAITLVALAVSFASAASGEIDATAVGTGAIGALVASAFGGVTTTLGGAMVVLAAYAVRTTRVRGPNTRIAHVALAAGAGAAAGMLVHSYIWSSLPIRLVASSMAVVLVLVPLLVPADDPVANLLERLAVSLPPSLRVPLLDTAELRRHCASLTAGFDRATLRDLGKMWSALVRLVEARARLDESRRIAPAHLTGRVPVRNVQKNITAPASEGAATTETVDSAYRGPTPSPADAVATMLERKIVDHIALLARAYTASDAANAAALGLDTHETSRAGAARENGETTAAAAE